MTTILLESGTNELEIVEFYINDTRYGVNVTKVEEVRYVPEYRSMPQTSDKILGFFNLRGKVIPIIDLPQILDASPLTLEAPQIIVMQFNKTVVGFLVERIAKIIRLSWKDILPPPYNYENHPTIGVIVDPAKQDDLIQLIDFERIVEEIIATFENREIEESISDSPETLDRSSYKVWIAEDSKMIEKLMKAGLDEVGYTQQRWFNNGASAWQAFLELDTHDLHEEIDILVTDIEMPQMDGLTLTKQIKDHPVYKTIPTIVFSSLINERTIHKCQEVGADTQVSKPDLATLVTCMDELIVQYATTSQ